MSQVCTHTVYIERSGETEFYKTQLFTNHKLHENDNLMQWIRSFLLDKRQRNICLLYSVLKVMSYGM
jgi:hypothetical protein